MAGLLALSDKHVKLTSSECCKHVACAAVHVHIQHEVCMLAASVFVTRQPSCFSLVYTAAGKVPLWVLHQLHLRPRSSVGIVPQAGYWTCTMTA